MIFGFLPQIPEDTEAAADGFHYVLARERRRGRGGDAAGLLARFRHELYFSFGMRRDALFDVADALACRPERVLMLAELCLEPECRRGHGGVYDALNSGDVMIDRLRRAAGAIPFGAWDDGQVRLAWLLADLPLEILGRLRSDRVMHCPAPPLPARPRSTGGRRPRHGRKLVFGDPATWPEPAAVTRTETSRYGTAEAKAWPRMHQRLWHRGAWQGHEGELPVVEGTLIRLEVDHLPGQRTADPVWLWASRAGTSDEEVDRAWQAFLRRFDLEHTFRFLKQGLGWTRPKLRDPAAADRWTWLVIAAYAQLFLARPLAADVRLPWQQPCRPGRLTPARVRRGYRRIRQDLPVPASAPKPSRPGPGRPAGSKNQRPAPRHDVGKTVKRTDSKPKNPGRQTLNNKLSELVQIRTSPT